MIDRLRALWNRPIADHERKPLFALVVVFLLAMAAVTYAVDGDDDGRVSAPGATAPPPPSPEPKSIDPTAAPRPQEQEEPGPNDVTRAEIAAAKTAAREFLTGGYLAYSYGRVDAEDVPRASDDLREEFAAEPPRLPPGTRPRRARVTGLQTNGSAESRIELLALITEEGDYYTIPLSVGNFDGRWLVFNVSPNGR